MIDLAAVLRDQGGVVALARRVARQPGKALTAAGRVLQSNWPSLVLPDPKAWPDNRRELEESGLLKAHLRTMDECFTDLAGQTIRGRNVVSGAMRQLHAELLWGLVRQRRPQVVVETGVCNGLSSAIILAALERNGSGRLVSIDLPEFSDPDLNPTEFWDGKGGAVVPAGKSVGWLVPETLRKPWALVLGRSQDVLGPTLKAEGPVDIFIHDSEHSYENQSLEFAAGYEALRPGGVLVATDINWSSAFDDFWARVTGKGARRAFVDPSCALVVKP